MPIDATSPPGLQRQHAAAWVPFVVAVTTIVALLAALSLRSDGRSEPGRRRPVIRASVLVHVRARIQLRCDAATSVAGAQVVLSPSKDSLESRKEVDRIRARIAFDSENKVALRRVAMGETRADGLVELEYTTLTDADDPLFAVDGGVRSGRFPFPTYVRVDFRPHGTMIRELSSSRRYRCVVKETESDLRYEVDAEFVVTCDPDASDSCELPSDSEATSASMDAMDAAARAREFRQR